jgi:nicotinamide mononucleotide transporter
MTTIEALAAIFGLGSVWLTARASVWCWPTGIANTVLFMVLFWDARLYGDVITNARFFAMSIYGWRAWAQGAGERGAAPLVVHRGSPATRAACAAIIVVATPLVGWIFATFTDAAYPWPDAAILVVSFVAQALLTRKIVDAWPLWVAVDVLAVGVYLARGLTITAGLYVVFLFLALHGWRAWRRRV